VCGDDEGECVVDMMSHEQSVLHVAAEESLVLTLANCVAGRDVYVVSPVPVKVEASGGCVGDCALARAPVAGRFLCVGDGGLMRVSRSI